MRVFVGSPLRADSDARLKMHTDYACRLCRAVTTAGHSPFAPHLFCTRYLHDGILFERSAGIKTGIDWLNVSDFAVFGTDMGVSDGMRHEIAACMVGGIPFLETDEDYLLQDLLTLQSVVTRCASESDTRRCCPWKL